MKKCLMLMASMAVAVLLTAGCLGAIPTPTTTPATPSPTPAPTPTPTPPPAVTYLEGRFESMSVSGRDITVPVGSSIDVRVVLNATATMRGELKVEVWRSLVTSPATFVRSCARATTLALGSQDLLVCEFTADDLTGAQFSHYFLKVYWSEVPLVTEPRAGEGVRTAPVQAATPTPLPVKEWQLDDIRVDGSTVTVSVRVFAGIDVRATLDGRQADEVTPALPFLEFVFRNVSPGTHEVEARDVVGHSDTAEVVVPAETSPDWLAALIQRLQHEPVTNPPASIVRYSYKGQTVYYVPPRCCDVFSDLYDANGNIIAHPDGGIAGHGDGRAADFFSERKAPQVIWQDQRTYDPNMVQVLAPIDEVGVSVMESFPPQYMLTVISGLPSGCVTFAGYYFERDGDSIRVKMVNWSPSDPNVACTSIYGMVETRIPIGSEFESGKTYTVEVNQVTHVFVAQ